MIRKDLNYPGLSILLLLLFISSPLFSQTYNFRNFDLNDGLPGRFVYTVNQDNAGFIWVGTGQAITRYDGFDFVPVPYSDSVSTSFPVTSLTASDGTIYYGMSDGSVYRVAGDKLIKTEGSDAFRINDLVETGEGSLLAISQSRGVFVIDHGSGNVTGKIGSSADDLLYSAAAVSETRLLVGTQHGLHLADFSEGSLVTIPGSDRLPMMKIQAIVRQPGTNRYIVGCEIDGLFMAVVEGDSIEISRIDELPEVNMARIQSLMFDNAGNLWVATFGDGAYKLSLDPVDGALKDIERFNTSGGLPGNDLKSIFQDLEGNIWMGLYGSGLSLLGSDAYSFYKPGRGDQDNNIIYVEDREGALIAGTRRGYYIFSPDDRKSVSYTSLETETGGTAITTYHSLNDGSLLVGTGGKGILSISETGRVSSFFSSGDNLQNYIYDIESDTLNTWIATMGGVILLNNKSGDYTAFTTYEQLPHNRVTHLVQDGTGKVFIATEGNRLYSVDQLSGVKSGKAAIYGGIRNRFRSVAVDDDGKVWGATEGAGVYCFAGDSVVNFSRQDGLLSDFCYSLLADSRGNIWVGHEQGFSVIDQEVGRIRSFADIFSEGADCNLNAVCETSEGLVAIGTTRGIIIYDNKLDQNRNVPPVTNIVSVVIDDTEYPFTESIELPYSKLYDVKINFVGLHYSDPTRVWYRTRLDNYDRDWSDPVYTRSVTYKLSSGNYRFNLMSFNFDGISDNSVEGFNITIRKPVWMMWWFFVLLFILAVGAVILIIRIRESALRRREAMLQDSLDERTREVIVQKEEIELKNREITDSINYAQRIQASLLPPVSKLKSAFTGAFVFYRPRDIVSGDFYWFEPVDEERYVIVCADSTGHGVPGAFMSMIGSALIQEIVTRKDITRPSEILTTLDRELSRTLNQGSGGDSSSDGMDMVVCEYNKKTRMLRFASAMRPVILVMDGESYYIRGNKNSVGGEKLRDKYFDDQEYFLKENDTVYMFSDGFPDQFGGEGGKKMKIARLKKLIEDINPLSMEEQNKRVSDFFDLWKGGLDQVDDVLLMAIRI